MIENLNGNVDLGDHWGVSSANGILGGFDLETLSVVEDGIYRANYFNPVANPGLDRFLSPLELYIMGVLPASEVPDTAVFRGVSQLNETNPCEDHGYIGNVYCFSATEQTMVSVEDIIDVVGERPYEGELDISLLIGQKKM